MSNKPNPADFTVPTKRAPTDTALERFVGAGDTASTASATQRVAPPPTGIAMKSRTVRFAVYIEEDVDNKLRVYCAEHRVTMSDVANVALESWLASQGVP